MGHPRNPRLLLSAILSAAVLTLPAIAHPQTKPSPLSEGRPPQIHDISIPPEFGYVLETHQPASPSVAATIIHIQEAHVNYEGQKHLAAILERLVKDWGLKLILVEGGEGDVSLTRLRRYGSAESRQQAAEEYLRTGLLSGEEYLDVVSEYPLILWGVESEPLYQENIQAFIQADALRETLRQALASIRRAVEVLIERQADPRLATLNRAARAFEEGSVGLGDYVETLVRLAGAAAISEAQFPNLNRLLVVQELERTIQSGKAEEEQRHLVERLRRAVSASELDALLAKAQDMQAGRVSKDTFYSSLEALTHAAGLTLKPYPNLARYIRSIELSAWIRPTELAEELDRMAAEVRVQLASQPSSRQLETIREQADLLEKLLDLRLSPREYERFQSLDLARPGAITNWGPTLNRLLSQEGLPTQAFEELDRVEAVLPTLQKFYETAEKRDEQIVERTVAKLAQTQEPIAVLITGGFHSPRITQLLKGRGLGVVVVAPKINLANNDEALYYAVLKYKSGHGSFDEVLAAAAP